MKILQEAEAKDNILKYLMQNKGKFISTEYIARDIEIDITSVNTYCDRIQEDGYVKYNIGISGNDAGITDAGVHFYNNGGYIGQFDEEKKSLAKDESDKEDERRTRKINRRTSIWAVIFSGIAIIISLISLLSQIFDWF